MSSEFTIGQIVLNGILQHEGITISALGVQLGLERSQVLYDINSGKTQGISIKMANRIKVTFPHHGVDMPH